MCDFCFNWFVLATITKCEHLSVVYVVLSLLDHNHFSTIGKYLCYLGHDQVSEAAFDFEHVNFVCYKGFFLLVMTCLCSMLGVVFVHPYGNSVWWGWRQDQLGSMGLLLERVVIRCGDLLEFQKIRSWNFSLVYTLYESKYVVIVIFVVIVVM